MKQKFPNSGGPRFGERNCTMNKVTLKQCAYFIAVAERGGIAHGARALNVSQSAVASAIAKLEGITGLILLHRHHASGTELTAHGSEFLRLAYQLVQSGEELEQKTRAIASNLAGTVKIGCFRTLAPFFIPRLIKQYRREQPRVSISLWEDSQDRLVAKLSDRSLHFALIFNVDLKTTTFSLKHVRTVKPYVVLSARHPLATQGAVKLSDLRNEPYIMLDGPAKNYFDSILSRVKLQSPVLLQSKSFEVVRSAVGHGLGFALLAMRPQINQTYDGEIVSYLPIKDVIAPLEIVLAKLRHSPQSKLLESFEKYCEHVWPKVSGTSTVSSE